MFALLPIFGGLLLGCFAPRRVALVLEVFFYAAALAILTATAPAHGAEYSDALWIAPILAVLSAGAVLIGSRFSRQNIERSAHS